MLLSVCAGGGEVHGCTAYLFMKQGYPSTRMKISMPNDCSSSALHFINCSCQKLSHVIYLYRNILVALRIIKDAVHKCRCIYSEDSNKSVTIEFRSCKMYSLHHFSVGGRFQCVCPHSVGSFAFLFLLQAVAENSQSGNEIICSFV